MLNKCVESYSINIGIIGEPKSGKTSLIEAIFGKSTLEKDRNLKGSPKKHSRLKGLRNDYEFPGRHNIKFAEIKALVSPRYDERIEYLRQIQIDDFDLVIFITENHLRAVRFLIMPDLNVPNSLKCLLFVVNLECISWFQTLFLRMTKN